eukprot:Selendium_serpulae@DN6053_c0_g3_i3.p1
MMQNNMVKTPRFQRLEARQALIERQEGGATTTLIGIGEMPEINKVVEKPPIEEEHQDIHAKETAIYPNKHEIVVDKQVVDAHDIPNSPQEVWKQPMKTDLPKLELTKLEAHPNMDDAEKWLDEVEQWAMRYRAWRVHDLALEWAWSHADHSIHFEGTVVLCS